MGVYLDTRSLPQAKLYPALLKTLSISNHGFPGRTWADNQEQYTRTSKLPSCIDYQNQKTTIQPGESSLDALKRGRSLEWGLTFHVEDVVSQLFTSRPWLSGNEMKTAELSICRSTIFYKRNRCTFKDTQWYHCKVQTAQQTGKTNFGDQVPTGLWS